MQLICSLIRFPRPGWDLNRTFVFGSGEAFCGGVNGLSFCLLFSCLGGNLALIPFDSLLKANFLIFFFYNFEEDGTFCNLYFKLVV